MDYPSGLTLLDFPIVIDPCSVCSMGGVGSWGSASASLTWSSTNRALYYPFRLASPLLVLTLWVCNGDVISGHWDVGIYTFDGRRLVSTGSTVPSGTQTVQVVDVADTLIGPGLFYLALACDNTTQRFFGQISGNAQYQQGMGVIQQSSAFPLPAIMGTVVRVTNDRVWKFGLGARGII